jgi:hypothetical protein
MVRNLHVREWYPRPVSLLLKITLPGRKLCSCPSLLSGCQKETKQQHVISVLGVSGRVVYDFTVVNPMVMDLTNQLVGLLGVAQVVYGANCIYMGIPRNPME